MPMNIYKLQISAAFGGPTKTIYGPQRIMNPNSETNALSNVYHCNDAYMIYPKHKIRIC